VWRCDFTRDDTLLATGSSDETVKLWRTSDGSLAHKVTGHASEVMCVACSPAADVLLSGDYHGVVTVWDTATGAELHTLPCHPKPVMSAAFDACGALAATGCRGGRIRLFDARGGWQRLHTLKAHARGARITGLAFGPAATASQLLASASEDGSTKVWDARNPRAPLLLHTLSHRSETVSFSPDGALLATGGKDRTVKLWRVADGALLHTVPAHGGFVYDAVFHPRDAAALATCGMEGASDCLTLWQL
jgi:WD40 repeat protein